MVVRVTAGLLTLLVLVGFLSWLIHDSSVNLLSGRMGVLKAVGGIIVLAMVVSSLSYLVAVVLTGSWSLGS